MTIVADQSETAAFLEGRLTGQGHEVRIIATHASLVFLSADRVYKLKRAVRFPFWTFPRPSDGSGSAKPSWH
jgi:aminoglycoside phosphotransferase family enzyme